jgi:hypothetical protein
MYSPLFYLGYPMSNRQNKTPVSKKAQQMPLRKRNTNLPKKSLVVAPNTIGFINTTTRPTYVYQSDKGFRVRHRELVSASVAGSTGFTLQATYSVNPGLASSFPWLSIAAAQFEQYVCHSLKYEYVPFSATSSAGSIMITPDYDSADPTPTTETQASDNVGTIEAGIWIPFCLPLNKADMHAIGPRKFVRPCAIAGDIKTFDVAKIFVSTNNCGSTSAIGRIYVEYDFEFFTPQNSPSPATFPQQTSLFGSTTSQTFTTNTAAAVKFSNTVYDPLSIGSPAAGVFTPPAGVYRVECLIEVADSSNEVFAGTLSIYKNGAALSTANMTGFNSAGLAGGPEEQMMVIGIIPCNGTDTFQFELTLIGAAGTLTVPANTSSLLVSLA